MLMKLMSALIIQIQILSLGTGIFSAKWFLFGHEMANGFKRRCNIHSLPKADACKKENFHQLALDRRIPRPMHEPQDRDAYTVQRNAFIPYYKNSWGRKIAGLS